jgi:hypothetical protein
MPVNGLVQFNGPVTIGLAGTVSNKSQYGDLEIQGLGFVT